MDTDLQAWCREIRSLTGADPLPVLQSVCEDLYGIMFRGDRMYGSRKSGSEEAGCYESEASLFCVVVGSVLRCLDGFLCT